jgi:glycine cleavage system regulatory protein
LVLTVIGDDRAGLVASLSEVVVAHDGNWERSQMAELAGKFAGIVVVAVPEERAADLLKALSAVGGFHDVAVYPGAESTMPTAATLTIDLLGNDRPGIVREVSTVLHRHDLSIETMDTGTREAPMAGGQLFEAHIVARLPQDVDEAMLREDLERLTAELLVDISVS